jgi:hypothetical protein
MTTLGELRPGSVFRTDDGRLGVRWEAESRQDRRTGCLWLDGHGFEAAPPADTPVEPLDLPALLAERDELLGLTHDLLIDSEAERRGREAERGEVVRLLEGLADRYGKVEARAGAEDQWGDVGEASAARRALEGVLVFVRARGPAATPDPPGRLAERVKVLETALARTVRMMEGYDMTSYEGTVDVLAAARAALEGAGGKQPT